MKQITPINTIGEVSRTIYAHYAQAGWHDFDSTSPVPHTAILEIEMEEPKPIQVAQIYDREQNPINGRIYYEDGIAPTSRTPSGGLSEPKIMQIGSDSPSSACNAKVLDTDGICPTLLDHKGAEPAILTPIRTDKAKELRRQGIETFANRELVPRTDGCSGTITTVQKDNLLQEPIKIRQATAQGYIECPAGGGFDAAYPNSKLRRGRVQNNGDVVGVLTASADNHCVYEGAEVIGSMQANAMRGSIDGVSPCLTEAMGMGGGQIPMVTESSILSYTRDDKGNVESYHEKEIAGTIHTSSGSGGNTDQFVKTRYRIRKLTPTECFRLMGVDDSDIDKLKSAKLTQTLKSGKVKEKPMPKTQLYKMAGNSIVVDVLYYIFKAMFVDEPPRPKPIQKSLFDI